MSHAKDAFYNLKWTGVNCRKLTIRESSFRENDDPGIDLTGNALSCKQPPGKRFPEKVFPKKTIRESYYPGTDYIPLSYLSFVYSLVHRYDEMAERVSEIPDDTEQLVELQRYHKTASACHQALGLLRVLKYSSTTRVVSYSGS